VHTIGFSSILDLITEKTTFKGLSGEVLHEKLESQPGICSTKPEPVTQFLTRTPLLAKNPTNVKPSRYHYCKIMPISPFNFPKSSVRRRNTSSSWYKYLGVWGNAPRQRAYDRREFLVGCP
jgi:hypothetical protein